MTDYQTQTPIVDFVRAWITAHDAWDDINTWPEPGRSTEARLALDIAVACATDSALSRAIVEHVITAAIVDLGLTGEMSTSTPAP